MPNLDALSRSFGPSSRSGSFSAFGGGGVGVRRLLERPSLKIREGSTPGSLRLGFLPPSAPEVASVVTASGEDTAGAVDELAIAFPEAGILQAMR